MDNTCCFFGHRTIKETKQLKIGLSAIIENLIVEEKIDMFLFGSRSQFNDLCYALVSEMQEKYPYIKRVYVRAEYPYISEQYEKYLLENYEDTYYPEKIIGSGKGVYVERNFEMINKSQFCIIYYDKAKIPTRRKSGTETALQYAIKQQRQIILFP